MRCKVQLSKYNAITYWGQDFYKTKYIAESETYCNNAESESYCTNMQEELDMSRLQVKQLNDLVSEADEIVKVWKIYFHHPFQSEMLPKFGKASLLSSSTGQRERSCPADRVNWQGPHAYQGLSYALAYYVYVRLYIYFVICYTKCMGDCEMYTGYFVHTLSWKLCLMYGICVSAEILNGHSSWTFPWPLCLTFGQVVFIGKGWMESYLSPAS